MQYKAWQANIGYRLHPVIKQHDHMHIADVGTGTGLVTTSSERTNVLILFPKDLAS